MFFTCFASFCYLVIHNILFHYIHAFIWILCTPLIIFIFLGCNFLVSCILCQSWHKLGEIVENVWFIFKTLHVRGRYTCPLWGGVVFHLVRGSPYFLLLVHRSCDHVYIHCDYLWYIYIYDVCLLHLPLHVLFLFYLYTHISLLYTIFYFCFTLRCLDEFCLKCFRNTSCQSLLTINYLLTKFFKSLC